MFKHLTFAATNVGVNGYKLWVGGAEKDLKRFNNCCYNYGFIHSKKLNNEASDLISIWVSKTNYARLLRRFGIYKKQVGNIPLRRHVGSNDYYSESQPTPEDLKESLRPSRNICLDKIVDRFKRKNEK